MYVSVWCDPEYTLKRRPKVNSLVKSTYINMPRYMIQVILFATTKKCWVFLCKFKAMFGSWGSDFPLCHSRPSMQLSMYVVSEELSKKYVWHRARREDYKWPPISLWVWHWLRMYDGNFPNFFRTMTFFGFIWVKFIYFEKAIKFCKISILLLTGTTQNQSKVEISQNFVAFLAYMNFTYGEEKGVYTIQGVSTRYVTL